MPTPTSETAAAESAIRDVDCTLKGLVSVPEACAFLSVKRTTLFALLHEGSIPKVKIKRRTLTTWEGLHRFVARSTISGS